MKGTTEVENSLERFESGFEQAEDSMGMTELKSSYLRKRRKNY
jgi:hypothetical protein